MSKPNLHISYFIILLIAITAINAYSQCQAGDPDSDSDGICDAQDVCTNGNDNNDLNNNGQIDACETCPTYDFNVYQPVSYWDDFGTFGLQDGGATVLIENNGWKAIEINFSITPQSVLTFDFKSTQQGELHWLVFDDNLQGGSPDAEFQVYGTQSVSSTINDFTYTNNGSWQSFSIPVGSYFTGFVNYLGLVADDDANANGNSYFRSIRLFQDGDGDLLCDCVDGTACQDGDPCTTGETLDSLCNCSGGITSADSDNDGVCDANDMCPNFDDGLIGLPCNDNNPNTVNDVWQLSCSCAGTPDVYINEILTQNYGSITNLYDEDGDSPDYIELHNTTNSTINLSAWRLVNEDNIWKIPTGTTISPNGYLSIWASEKDKSGPQLHTNFKLNNKGEYLGLYDSQNRLVYDFGDKYPHQYNNLSYGLNSNGALNYFNIVTKNAPNGNAYVGKVSVPVPSFGRGYYDNSLQEILTTETPNALIRYTLDGTEVNNSSAIYANAINVNANSSGIVTLRAKAFAAGYIASDEISVSYIFPNSIFPNNINAQQGISSLPMVVLNQDNQNDLNCLDNNNNCPKRDIIFEYFEIDTLNISDGTYTNASASEFGQFNVVFSEDKLNIRVHFDPIYGDKYLDYPIFKNYEYNNVKPVDKFRKIEIRGCYFDSYEGEGNYPAAGMYVTENWWRSTELHLMDLGQHTRFVNIFINGEFRGISTLRERFDHHNYANYKNLNNNDISSLKVDNRANTTNANNGNTNFWNTLLNTSNYQNVKNNINSSSLIVQKLMESLWYGNGETEYRVVYPTITNQKNKLYLINSDVDLTFRNAVSNIWAGWDPGGYHPYVVNNAESLPMWYDFIDDAEFRQDVYELTTKAFCQDGILSVSEAKANLNKWASEANQAMYSELARTNRTNISGSSYNYNTWQSRINTALSMLDELPDMYNGWSQQGLYNGCDLRPIVDTENQISEINSPVSYIINAIDPDSDAMNFSVISGLPPGLSLNPTTGEFTGSPTQLGTYYVKIKVGDTNNKWGYHDFIWEVINLNVQAGGELVINEIHYNPADSILPNGGKINGTNFEFIELKNVGTADVILRGKVFTKGIDLEISQAITIPPNGFVVFANKACWFYEKYGFFPDGEYKDNLDNDGENLRLKGPYKSILDSLTYDDGGQWPGTPDKGLYSLALKLGDLDNTDPLNWSIQSTYTTPRAENDFTNFGQHTFSGLVINEIHYNPFPKLDPITGDTLEDGRKFEFVELKNITQSRIYLDSVIFSRGINYEFQANEFIEPSEFLVLAEDKSSFLERYGIAAYDNYNGKLDNGGETIWLQRNTSGGPVLLDVVTYDDALPWDTEADGGMTDYSLALIDPILDNNTWLNWQVQCNGVLWTPGAENESCQTNCIPTLIENNSSIIVQSESVEQYIQTNGLVLNGDIEYQAGDYILLNEGFEVKQGAVFHAFIALCN